MESKSKCISVCKKHNNPNHGLDFCEPHSNILYFSINDTLNVQVLKGDTKLQLNRLDKRIVLCKLSKKISQSHISLNGNHAWSVCSIKCNLRFPVTCDLSFSSAQRKPICWYWRSSSLELWWIVLGELLTSGPFVTFLFKFDRDYCISL